MKKNIFFAVAVLVVIVAGGIVFFGIMNAGRKVAVQGKPRIIEEKLVIPDTQTVHETEARMLEQTGVAVPLVPKSEEEKVVVVHA